MPVRPRVLVIDDDPLFRRLILGLLRRDFLVSVASEGSEGFRKALAHPPDLAIIDIQMPGWDGLTTLQSFRAHPSLAQVPIVILTVDASRKTVTAAVEGGANDYLIKTNFSKDDFYRKLRRWLPRAREPRTSSPPTTTDRAPATAAIAAPTTLVPPQVETVASAATGSDPDVARLRELIDAWE